MQNKNSITCTVNPSVKGTGKFIKLSKSLGLSVCTEIGFLPKLGSPWILQGWCYSSFCFQCSVVCPMSFDLFCWPWSCLSSDLTISVCPFGIFKFLMLQNLAGGKPKSFLNIFYFGIFNINTSKIMIWKKLFVYQSQLYFQ